MTKKINELRKPNQPTKDLLVNELNNHISEMSRIALTVLNDIENKVKAMIQQT